MNIFKNRDIRVLFTRLACTLGGSMLLVQLAAWFIQGTLSLSVFLFTLLISICILIILFLYFRQQNKQIEDAIMQINRFLSGDIEARIDCAQEGALFKLFHAINTLSTTLDAHAVRELKTKQFLRDSISDISHQIKTPLAALEVYIALLQEEQDDAVAVKAFAYKSEREIERIENLVQNLLKITRLDAGFIVMEKHAYNVAILMNDIRLRFEIRAEIEEKEILLSGPEDAEIFCDRIWIIEAISNLVKNALDHMEARGRIEITWKILPTVTQIAVKDDGDGIHQADIYHIFKRFYRSRFSKDTQGIGLGLPLAKAIIEAHDGNIAVESDLGNGSTFVVSFLNLTKV